MTANAEVWFYHLERAGLERVLPDLLEKTLARGWRAEVRSTSEERLDYLNTHLWTYRQDSFLPHGAARDGTPEDQPIHLTLDEGNANKADVLFLVDGAAPGDLSAYARCITIFDGRDKEATDAARAFWTEVKGQGHAVAYWQQSAAGKWEKKG